MRDLKFRAWVKGTKMSYINYPEGLTYVDGRMTYWYEVNHSAPLDEVIMQYTGLKDKNGKEIYEGDIILAHQHSANYPLKYVIVFNEEESGFRMRWQDRYNKNESGFYDEKIAENNYKVFKVIGNIYQSPELIQK